MNARKQTGLAAVEMAIVSMLALIVLFGVIEISRLFFVVNALEEATRRGARVATVCQLNDQAVLQNAIFNDSGNAGASGLIRNLSTGDVALEYLDEAGSVIGDPVGNYLDISFVRVQIANYQHRLIIPLFTRTIGLPTFSTTLPRESLGVTREGYTTC